MIDINKRLTENQKYFFNRLSINVDDIYIHFYGSIKRLDYIENKSDIDEIKAEYIEGLTFHYVKEMSEVIDVALTNQKVKNAKKL